MSSVNQRFIRCPFPVLLGSAVSVLLLSFVRSAGIFLSVSLVVWRALFWLLGYTADQGGDTVLAEPAGRWEQAQCWA